RRPAEHGLVPACRGPRLRALVDRWLGAGTASMGAVAGVHAGGRSIRRREAGDSSPARRSWHRDRRRPVPLVPRGVDAAGWQDPELRGDDCQALFDGARSAIGGQWDRDARYVWPTAPEEQARPAEG